MHSYQLCYTKARGVYRCMHDNIMISKLHLICAALVLAFALSSAEATTAPANSTTITSPWHEKKQKPPHGLPSTEQDCWYQPWMCRDSEWPFGRRRTMCCMNSCVDVLSDPDNCGLCGVRCEFGRQCCSGFCANVMRSPFHCGSCFNRCPLGSFCLYGLCSYAQPPQRKPRHKPPAQFEPPEPEQPFHPKTPKPEPQFHPKPPLHPKPPKPEPVFRHKPPKPEPPFHHKRPKPPEDPTQPPPEDPDRTTRHRHLS